MLPFNDSYLETLALFILRYKSEEVDYFQLMNNLGKILPAWLCSRDSCFMPKTKPVFLTSFGVART